MSRPNRGPMAGAGAPTEKAKDTKKSVKKLLLFCQPHYLLIAFCPYFFDCWNHSYPDWT